MAANDAATDDGISQMRVSATIETDEVASGWTYVRLAGSKAIFGTGNPVKIKGTVDAVPIEATLMPDGTGDHMLPLKKAIVKTLAKSAGDEVEVSISRREVSR